MPLSLHGRRVGVLARSGHQALEHRLSIQISVVLIPSCVLNDRLPLGLQLGISRGGGNSRIFLRHIE